MSVVPITTAGVSNLLQGQLPLQSIDQTQEQLLQLQNELSTGKSVNTPSDNPAAAAAIEQLNQAIQQSTAYNNNLQTAQSSLSQADSSMGSLQTLLTQAQSIASQNVGSTASATQRSAAADVVQSLYSQLLSIANTSNNGVYLFGGENSATAPFVQTANGIEYVGSTATLQTAVDQNMDQSFQVDGANLFGALSDAVQGSVNLAPSLSGTTRVSDLGGATNSGVQLGSIVISNGTQNATVNLGQADDLNDVVAAINAAGLSGVTASVGADGINIAAGASANLTVTESGNGSTATDLGILQTTAAGTGVSITGAALHPQLTDLTPLSQLAGGNPIDLSSGIVITNGQVSKTLTFGSPPLPANATVEDLLNEINGAGLGVRAQIDPDGTGIDILNQAQGTNMTIGENGGTTAADLGIRSYSGATELTQLNNGQGVSTAANGAADFSITDSKGVSFQVTVGSDKTIQDVINTINSDATTAGAGVTASFAAQGNGIVLTDTAGGSGTLSLLPINSSQAAADLGLTGQASGNVITGTDVNPVSANGIFGDLMALENALNNNNTADITAAAQALQTDQNHVTATNGAVGAQMQQVQSRQTELSDQNTATQTMLSNLQDVDYTQAITQYQSLQNALQASMESASNVMNLSLLDFLE
jgi:flagellar hook-associated protein 3